MTHVHRPQPGHLSEKDIVCLLAEQPAQYLAGWLRQWSLSTNAERAQMIESIHDEGTA